ncbi:4-aminobutyrate transaminase [Halobacillus halophilus]|uniref:(S)-3-amino-2-methylpropionate transaminase n=1 Tax=Halobacillus halophilus (strain ATCC 35676 / DSM 2266 / JCM 20832 / KCTC 3685 / LMG 17431 / NBRC 102448 / NCIMB 2269) TaxID=866895 RepID=I0JKR8_HALH3|nr:4-aminobutyrate--2-oxoglutarate transaminase [Halobacillus halophilus]ASF38869.1 4-aminobutyrate transaminase [Halobacillus halophilus]CCG44738.1 4-aminobutyrate aminotransferase [Halobacillus halophilus DSM 2266]
MTNKTVSKDDLQRKRKKYIPKGIGNGNTNIADYARGARVFDNEGREWIDFAGAIGTLNVGHTHPKVTEAVKNQADRYLHPGFNVIMYDSYINLAEKLCTITPGSFDKMAMLFNSGAEAVENAVKVARKYTNRQAVVSFERGFHGRTNLTMGMTSKVKPYKYNFGPYTPEIYQAPYPYMSNKPEQMTDEEYIDYSIMRFKEYFVTAVAPETVACIVMEPVQGEGGFIIPPKRFVQEVRDFCSEHGIVFVADEIQTGFARTGRLFASEHFDIEPDVMTLSKSLAAGMPLSAVVGKAEIMDASSPGELGGTYAGNPVACEAALAVIEVMEEENLSDKAEQIGATLEDKLEELKARHDYLGDIRRLGAMVAVEIIDAEGNPDKAKTGAITSYANNNGLLLLSAGVKGNVVRFLTPLVITDEELNKGLTILEQAFDEAAD